MIAWFWLVKLTLVAVTLYILYLAIAKHKFKSKLWNVMAVIALIIGYIMPVKLVPATDNVNAIQNIQIEQSKVLPPMVTDNSFEKSTNVVGITSEDLK